MFYVYQKLKKAKGGKAQSADCAGSGPETTPLREEMNSMVTKFWYGHNASFINALKYVGFFVNKDVSEKRFLGSTFEEIKKLD